MIQTSGYRNAPFSLPLIQMNIYIYTLKDPITNEIRYIGQTVNPSRRLNRHINNSKNLEDKRHINNWIRNINQNPIMDIIEICDYSIRNSREEYWINYYKDKGYNLCNSSNGGAGAGINNTNCLHRVLSEHTKSKISISNKGRKFHGKPILSNNKKVYQYDKQLNLINSYNSIKDATVSTGLNRTTIRRNIQKISSSKLFIWTDTLL